MNGTYCTAENTCVQPVRSPIDQAPVFAHRHIPLSQNLLQRKAETSACGGSCPRCQAKLNLTISQPHDPAEVEADQTAYAVMRMTAQEAEATTVAVGAPQTLRRTCVTATDSVSEMINSPGQPLPTEIRDFFEPRIGQNMSHVRVHTGEKAQQSARELNALAYTVGSHVVFNAGEYEPYFSEGKRLLAHELIHVVQQTAKPVIEFDRQNDASVGPVISKELRPIIQRSGPAVGEVAPMPTQIFLSIGQEASLLDSAVEGAKVLAKLPQGSSVKLVSVHDDWYAVEAQVSGESLIGFIKSIDVQSPPQLQGQQMSDPVTNTFANAMGAKAEMVWVPHPGNPKYEVAVCDTGFVSLVYAREVANLAVILQATMSDATKTPVEDWRSAKTIQCRNAP